jgi:hypothetical protein
MHKKLVLILAFVLFLNFPQSVFANVLINEVQIGVEGNANDEFIELYNNSSTEVALTGFSIYKKTSSGAESSVVAKSRFEDKKIPANGILFLAREGEYTGTKTVDISWPNSYSLASNNSLTLYKDYENKIIEDTASWGDVKNFKRTSTNTDNTEEENTNTQNENTTVPTIGGSSSSASTVAQPKKKSELKIISKSFGFVGIPVEFEARLEGVESQNMYAKYVWNFGDGDSMEVIGFDNKKFTHTYYYPGDYLVNIEYFANSYQASPDYIAKINLKIVPTTVVISNVGTEADFFIELTNNSSLDIDISNWVLLGNNKIFTLPKSTNLLSMKKIILPPRVTNFNHGDKNFLELLDKNGTLIFSYKNILNLPKIKTAKTPRKIASLNTENISLSERIGETFVSENESYNQNFENEDLSSAVILSDDKNGEKNNLIYIFLFIFLIIFATLTVYFLRRNGKEEEDEEFDILEE